MRCSNAGTALGIVSQAPEHNSTRPGRQLRLRQHSTRRFGRRCCAAVVGGLRGRGHATGGHRSSLRSTVQAALGPPPGPPRPLKSLLAAHPPLCDSRRERGRPKLRPVVPSSTLPTAPFAATASEASLELSSSRRLVRCIASGPRDVDRLDRLALDIRRLRAGWTGGVHCRLGDQWPRGAQDAHAARSVRSRATSVDAEQTANWRPVEMHASTNRSPRRSRRPGRARAFAACVAVASD